MAQAGSHRSYYTAPLLPPYSPAERVAALSCHPDALDQATASLLAQLKWTQATATEHYLEATRQEYYARLLTVTQNGQWEEWLTYFLRGVAIQAEDAIGRIQRIDELFQHWSEQLAGIQSGQSEKVLELFVENPFWTVREIAQRLAVAYTTARRALDRLESAGIVTLIGDARRNRVYCARAMLEVLEAPSTPRQNDHREPTR